MMKYNKVILLCVLLICLIFSSSFVSKQWDSLFENEAPLLGKFNHQQPNAVEAQTKLHLLSKRQGEAILTKNSNTELKKLSLRIKNLEFQLDSLSRSKENDLKLDMVADFTENADYMENFADNLDTYFLNEDDDHSWSATMEANFQSTFEELSADKNPLTSIECRSTICKLEILNNDGNNGLSILRNVLAKETGKNEVFYKTIDDSGELITQVFLSRDGHSLPDDIESLSGI